MDISWAYSGYILAFGALWATLYWYRPDLRSEMMIMSFFAMPLGPVGDFFYRVDYYNLPNLNGEYWWIFSAAVGFVYGGVAAVLYEELWGERFRTRRARSRHAHIYWFLGVAVLWSVFMITMQEFFSINSLYSSLAVMGVAGGGALWLRHDLWKDAIGSGVALMGASTLYYFGALMFFPNLFSEWNALALSGIYIVRIPLEEYVWAFAWGFIAGPAYEYARGFSFAKNK